MYKAKIDNFVNYVLDFYGPDGIYGFDAAYVEAVQALAQHLLEAKIPFDGDTVDREKVRDIMLSNRGIT